MRVERKEWIDIIKGLGIIAVMMGHIYKNQAVGDWIYSFHMPLFFFVGGLVFKEKAVWENIKRRFYMTLVPYFFFGILTAFYGCLVEARFRDMSLSVTDALLGLFRAQYDSLDFNVPLWFLPCYFVVAVFYNILCRIGKKQLAWVVAGIMLVIQILVPMPQLPWGLDRTFIYMPFFALGHIIGSFSIDEKLIKLNNIVKCVLSLGFLAVSVLLVHFGLWYGAYMYIAALIGIFACMVFSMLIHKNSLLQYLGRTTIVTLCVHGPIYRALTKIISILINQDTDILRSNILWSVIIAAITFGICAIGYEVLKRILPWVVGVKKQ